MIKSKMASQFLSTLPKSLLEMASRRPEAIALGSPQTLKSSKVGSDHHIRGVAEAA
jgi:hypothetical protein